MLPRFLFMIIVASCWLQINAVPFHSRNNYQDDDDSEDVMDYAFPNDQEDTDDKVSIFDTVKNTIDTMDKLGTLKDKNNINLNANTPRKKKTGKKSKSKSRKRKLVKDHHNDNKNFTTIDTTTHKIHNNGSKNVGDITRRSTQELPENIPEDSDIVKKHKRKLNEIKSQNHCAYSRRSNNEKYSRNINMNSSYLNIDEDFTMSSKAKMKKIHTVFTNEYITLCWIETTTIKEDKTFDPPKRLVLRESTITFENSATIPDDYLSCPIVDGDITMESDEILCNTAFVESIDEETRSSRTVNLTKFSWENNIYVQTNKIIKCSMGPVITKDVYQWSNDTESTRQRIEIKVSPLIYNTEDICNNYEKDISSHLSNDSIECSNENEPDESEEVKKLMKNLTRCYGENCLDEQTTISSVDINDVLTTSKPSIVSEINDVLSTGFTRNPFATEPPKIKIPIDQDIELSQSIPCTGSNCPENNSELISQEESCEGYECENSASIDGHKSEEISGENLNTIDNNTLTIVSSSDESVGKKTDQFNIPMESLEHSSDESKNDESDGELMTVNELFSSEEEKHKKLNEIDVENFVIDVSTNPTILPDNLWYPGIAVTSSELPSIENIKVGTIENSFIANDESMVEESNQNLSSENISDEFNSALNQDNSWESLPVENIEILLNETKNIDFISDSEELENTSTESDEININSNNTKSIETCDQSNNCSKLNYTNISRNASPSMQFNIQATSTHNTNEDEDSGSCDCDEDSLELKKCDPKTGLCLPEFHQSHTYITPTQSINNLDEIKNKSISYDNIETLSTISEQEKENNEEILQNHKLSLKIYVTLEHIDENKENHKLAQVEKALTLNELPSEHGNHSLYRHIQSLNKSINNIDLLKDIFNCTILEKLTEQEIINKLNLTNLNNDDIYDDDDDDDDNFTIHERIRRSVDNITSINTNNYSNESLINGSIVKECILPNIREDIRNGLHDILTQLSTVINKSINNTTEIPIINSTIIINNDTNTMELSKNSTNRNKRSLMNNNNDGDIEEISRWTKERFVPSIDGGHLRSFTEMKILKNPE